jgi:cyanophycinase-like exopeptidase
MTFGPIGLHGGGEFLPGDEPFLRALLEAAAAPAEERARACGRAGPDEPIRVAIVPTAAARQRPDLAAANGVGALERLLPEIGRPLRAESVAVIDAASAGDPTNAERLAAADLIHFPGGDPAVIPTVLPGTLAWSAILAARARGAVLAGASAGAMALAPWTWTPTGGLAGLDLVPGLVVMPHADEAQWARFAGQFPEARAAGLGILGLGERTGVLSEPADPDSAWRVVGPGEVRWLDREGTFSIVRTGERLRLPR